MSSSSSSLMRNEHVSSSSSGSSSGSLNDANSHSIDEHEHEHEHEHSESGVNVKEEAALEEEQLEKAREEDERFIAPLYRDTSPEARAGRRRAMLRAVCGEFVGSCLLFFLVCSISISAQRLSLSPGASLSPASVAIMNALGTTMCVIPLVYCFADISGAHFNPAVTFACWITSRTSNRKCVLFIFAQLVGSVVSMLILWCVFPNSSWSELFTMVTITPRQDDKGRVFAMEFFQTFVLIFCVFALVFDDVEASKRETMTWKGIANSRGLTVYAATPQSKTGFAPIAIGFLIGALSLFGGTVSGGAFNPARMFGPALMSGVWDWLWLYWIAQFSGAAAGAGLRGAFLKFGGNRKELQKDDRVFSHNHHHFHQLEREKKKRSSDILISLDRHK